MLILTARLRATKWFTFCTLHIFFKNFVEQVFNSGSSNYLDYLRRRIALAKQAFNKKKNFVLNLSASSWKKTHRQSICVEYSVVWKGDMDIAKEWHKKDWTIWYVDLASHVEGILDEAQKSNEMLRTVETRSELMDTLKTRQKRWLGHCVATWFFSENRVGRSTAREERKKQNVCYWAGY